MRRHHVVAFTLATAVALAAIVDTIVLASTGHRTFLTDDAQATVAQSAALTLLLLSAYLSQALVIRAESARFAAGNRLVRATRWPLIAGLVVVSVGVGAVHPLILATGTTGTLLAVSDACAGIALLVVFGSAVVLGLATLRHNPLGIGARVLSALLPMVAVTVLLGFVATDLASPIFLSVVTGFGLALLGVRAEAPAIESSSGRTPSGDGLHILN